MTTEKQLSKQEQSRIAKAVQDGQKIIKEGGTKVEASMTVLRAIHDLDQETVVKAFIEGASLTPKAPEQISAITTYKVPNHPTTFSLW